MAGAQGLQRGATMPYYTKPGLWMAVLVVSMLCSC
jgi:hypothetical protein